MEIFRRLSYKWFWSSGEIVGWRYSCGKCGGIDRGRSKEWMRFFKECVYCKGKWVVDRFLKNINSK